MSEATHNEKRFDDYSQDANVERHVRKNRWVSLDFGGKPYVSMRSFFVSADVNFALLKNEIQSKVQRDNLFSD